jgi:CubicO group peptidase (beta-lactamase class C family)
MKIWIARAPIGRAAHVDLEPIIASVRDGVLAVKQRDGMPGVAVALIGGDGPIWSACFGEVDLAGSRPIDPRTIFSLQSTSKTFTATAVMLAVQQGLLDLDAPMNNLLPGFVLKSRYEDRPERKITLRHLLSHRAGLTHEAPVGGNFQPELETACPSFEAHVASIADTWLRYPVGQRYAYSNLGIDLAGAILARACGVPFGECLRTLIFEPLGMSDATATAGDYEARENRAIGHQPGFERVALRIPLEASGGVYASLADMVRFARFHLGRGTLDGRQLLAPALWRGMHTPTFDGVRYALGITAAPLRLERGSPMLFNHNGGGFGFGSCFSYCPEQQLAWVVMHNGQTRPGPPAPFDRIGLHEALIVGLGARAPLPRPAAPVVPPPREALAPFAGTYISGVAVASFTWKDDAFGLTLPGDEAPAELAFTGPGEAYFSGGPRASLGVRLHPQAGAQPPWLQFEHADVDSPFLFSAGSSVDLNEPEAAPPGNIGEAYDRFLGAYQVIQWGVPIMTVPIFKTNGWLWIGPIQLTEYAPGLLFSGDGEALDLTRDPPTYRNIPLHRLDP